MWNLANISVAVNKRQKNPKGQLRMEIQRHEIHWRQATERRQSSKQPNREYLDDDQ